MTKTLICELAFAACLLSGGAVARIAHGTRATGLADRQLALDGAFRDGLFVGRLTAAAGRPAHPPVGRWSSDSDRASFLAGYGRGYGAVVHAPIRAQQRTE
jgi:hypothetical protein